MTEFFDDMGHNVRVTLHFASCCLLAAALSGCEGGIDDRTEAMEVRDLRNATLTVKPDCLDDVWKRQVSDDRAFDRAHDAVEGGSLSCATGSSPKAFDTLLAQMRAAGAKKDRAALAPMLHAPLLFIDAKGERSELATRADVDAKASAMLTDALLASMARVDMDRTTVVPDQGAFFDLGAIWIAAREEGRPMIVTVNLQALEEARVAHGRSER